MQMEHRRKRHLSDGDQLDANNKRPSLVISSNVPVSNSENCSPSIMEGRRLLQPTDGQQPPPEQPVAATPPSPPESEHHSSDDDDDEDEDEEEQEDPVMAGYEYCSKEAIRFLLEEEKLSADHPVIRQLLLHLEAGRNNVGVGSPSSSI